MQTMPRIIALLMLFAAGLAVAACSPSGPTKKVCYPVKGELTVGGKPAEGATVMFQPREAEPTDWAAGYPRATVGADGKFEVSTYGENDGAPAGDYVILVTWPTPNPADEE